MSVRESYTREEEEGLWTGTLGDSGAPLRPRLVEGEGVCVCVREGRQFELTTNCLVPIPD